MSEVEPKDQRRDPGSEAAEEASGGSLPSNPELEEALRAATESVEAIQAERKGDAEGSDAQLASLREQLAAREAELAALADQHQRLQADLDNVRKRSLKERQDAHNYGHENLVKDLLSTVDNLDRAVDHARASEGGDFEAMLQGVELVQRELIAALDRHGVTVIEAEGLPFDPTEHEAMAQQEDDSVPANTVIQVFMKGYRLRDRLLRPAKVVVSKASPASVADEPSGRGADEAAAPGEEGDPSA